MNFNLDKLIRENIKRLKPYSSARDEFSGKGDYVFLDANENALGSVGSTINYNRYPDPYQKEVKELIAIQQNVEITQIFIGNGSDEAIDLLFRAFCEPKKDKILTMSPTYGMYQVSAGINDVEIVNVSLTADYQIDIEKVLEVIKTDESIKIIFICSPNNPTGNLIDKESIITLLKQFQGLVVVDEAYIDFEPKGSMLTHLNDYLNLVVLQTFSKAYGLANLRLGKAYASEAIIEIFNKIKPPYNVNGYSQEVAVSALKAISEKERYIKNIIQEREKLGQSLQDLELVEGVYPSNANFLLVKMKGNASEIYKALITDRTVVRNRSKVHLCDNCLRFTIGTAEENKVLLDQLYRLTENS